MTHRLSMILGIVFTLCVLADLTLNSGALLTFAARKGAALVNYLKFWRL